MQRLGRIACAVLCTVIMNASAFAGGEYQGYEALPRITDIRFNEFAIGFVDSNRSRYVPEGPRFFILERGADDWQRTNRDDFIALFSPAPPVHERIDRDTFALRASDGTAYVAIGGYCSEGVRFHGGLRLAGNWINLYQSLCYTPSAVEHVGDALLVGTFYDGEAGNLSGGAPLVVVDRRTQRLIKQTRIGGILSVIRHDPITGDTWVASRSGLYRLDRDFESQAYFRFSDQFDKSGKVVTRLNGENDERYIAQLARAMRVKDTQYFRSVLAGRNELRLMYGFGMGGWWPDETRTLLEPWLVDGKLDPALNDLPEKESAALPPNTPRTTLLHGGGYADKLDNFARHDRSRSIVHARWLAWKRLENDKYERTCIAATKTRPSPENGYFRILPNAWQLEGDWVGAELELLIPDGGDHVLISPYRELLDRYSNDRPVTRGAEFLRNCPEPEFSDESLWEDELDELEAFQKRHETN